MIERPSNALPGRTALVPWTRPEINEMMRLRACGLTTAQISLELADIGWPRRTTSAVKACIWRQPRPDGKMRKTSAWADGQPRNILKPHGTPTKPMKVAEADRKYAPRIKWSEGEIRELKRLRARNLSHPQVASALEEEGWPRRTAGAICSQLTRRLNGRAYRRRIENGPDGKYQYALKPPDTPKRPRRRLSKPREGARLTEA